MKIISTVEDFHAHVQAHGGVYRDLRTQVRIPLEVVERMLLEGKAIHVPETAEEVERIFAANVRAVGRTDGWMAAAKMFADHGDRDWSGFSRQKRRSLASFLRRKYD